MSSSWLDPVQLGGLETNTVYLDHNFNRIRDALGQLSTQYLTMIQRTCQSMCGRVTQTRREVICGDF